MGGWGQRAERAAKGEGPGASALFTGTLMRGGPWSNPKEPLGQAELNPWGLVDSKVRSGLGLG